MAGLPASWPGAIRRDCRSVHPSSRRQTAKLRSDSRTGSWPQQASSLQQECSRIVLQTASTRLRKAERCRRSLAWGSSRRSCLSPALPWTLASSPLRGVRSFLLVQVRLASLVLAVSVLRASSLRCCSQRGILGQLSVLGSELATEISDFTSVAGADGFTATWLKKREAAGFFSSACFVVLLNIELGVLLKNPPVVCAGFPEKKFFCYASLPLQGQTYFACHRLR